MAWESIVASHGGSRHGTDWKIVPAVSLSKTNLTFNKPAVETFRIKRGSYVRLLFDPDRRIIGVKIIPTGDSLVGAYKVGADKNGRGNLSITCKQLCVRVSDCWQRAFRCHLNPGERIIEIELSPDNALS